jgi:enolase
MEAKTMAEIISVNLVPVIACGGQAGVQAIVETNISRFVGEAAVRYADEEEDMFRDMSELLSKCQESLLKKDPRQMADVDAVISGIEGITGPIKLALSIACCKAAARHKVTCLFVPPYCAETSAG